jgi:hypothetical protein
VATIADNIDSMAALVSGVKKKYHLQEQTIMRIVDMNFALAQSASASSFGGGEDFPFGTEDDQAPGQMVMFPETDEETAAALGIVPEFSPEKED